MKIVILEGSPNRNGSSNMLAASFRHGAEEAGHTVEIIDTAHADIHPCTGCVRCGYEGPCVQRDDVEKLNISHINPLNPDKSNVLQGAGRYKHFNPDHL